MDLTQLSQNPLVWGTAVLIVSGVVAFRRGNVLLGATLLALSVAAVVVLINEVLGSFWVVAR